MTPRLTRFLTYFLLSLAPLVLLLAFNYWIAARLNVQTTSENLQESINSVAVNIDADLRDEETKLRRVASSIAVRQFLARYASVSSNDRTKPEDRDEQLFNDLSVAFASVLNVDGKISGLTLYKENRFLLTARRSNDQPERVSFAVKDSPPQRLSPDILQHNEFTRIPNSNILKFAAPASSGLSAGGGVLVGEVSLDELLIESARRLTTEPAYLTAAAISFVWDADGKILYHPNPAERGKSLADVYPQLKFLSGVGPSGIERFQTSSGRDYLVAYSPLPRLNVKIALARDVSKATSSITRWAIGSLGLAVGLAFVSALLLELFVQRKTSGLEQVTKGLTAVAKGELDHRVELRSSDEARSAAEDLRALTERLRNQLAREAETQQFQSFFRLSAMLTHDLKNAIEALSLTVGNMERHFDNEQFRVDAMKSLTTATNKLKTLVARLSRPITSLSGEHKLPSRVDLVPALNQALKSTVEPMHGRHTIEVKVPPQLFAVTDVGRIEEVFENLLLNSLDAMSHKTGKLTIEATTSQAETVISITDTGSGISESFIKDSLFQPFKTTKKHGIGLGLYTCREVVRASGGRIEVESTQGIGTTFRVVLPSGT